MKKITYLLLFFSISIITSVQAVTRYWVGTSGNFDDGNHWSLTSGGSPIGGTINWDDTDIAIFNSLSGSPTVTIISSENIGKLQISGSITVTFKPSTGGNRYLTINTIASDALTVASVSTLIVSGLNNGTSDRDMTVQLDSDYGIIANIYGIVKVIHDDEGIGQFEKGSSSTINFNSGSLYQHDVNGDALPNASWNTNSTCLITGVTDNIPSNTDQPFGNFTWNCSGQNQELNFAGNFYDVNGNLAILSTNNYILRLSLTAMTNMVVDGNYSQSGNSTFAMAGTTNNTMTVKGDFLLTGGIFYLCTSTAYPTLSIEGDFSMTGSANSFISYLGTSNYSTVNFNGTGVQAFTKSAGTMYYRIYFYVRAGATLDLGSSILGDYLYTNGTFTLESGAGLRTTHSQGIVTSGDAGCVRISGARNYNSGANYTYYRNGAQSSGNGLVTSLSGILTIGSSINATALTLTNGSVAINNKLVLVSNASSNSSIASGTISYGSSGRLEYQGACVQTTTNIEYPVHPNGPPDVIINNPNNVILNNSKFVKNDLTLTTGSLTLNGYTLTLQRYIYKTSGGLTGGTTSCIVIEGGANNTSLPGVTNGLDYLTINRPSAIITLTGNINVTSTMTMTAGTLSSGGGVISYGSSGLLNYNGSAVQTTSSTEFPAAGGPNTLEINNSSTVNLHASRTLNGPLNLLNGNFTICTSTLTLNNIIVKTSGSMTGSTTSDIVFGECTSSTTLPAITLGNLTIDRSPGISMGGDVTVENTLTLTNGIFIIGSNMLALNGQIIYSSGNLSGGAESELTCGGTNTITHINNLELLTLGINRSGGTIIMDDDISVFDQINLDNGTLSIGSNMLTIYGSINQTLGSLAGGMTSDIDFSGDFPFTILPGVDLNDLIINRPSGVEMNGDVTIYGDLLMNSGTLDVGPYHLILNGPEITIHPEFLITDFSSSLTFGGTQIQVAIPAVVTELNNLTINNPNEVILNANMNIYGNMSVLGFLNAGVSQINGTGNFMLGMGGKLNTGHPEGINGCIQLTGSRSFSSFATYGFIGTVNQQANLPTFTVPGLVETLNISNSPGSIVHLADNLTVFNTLVISSGSKLDVSANTNLTASGTAILNGSECLILNTDGLGSASFIDNNIFYLEGGSVVAERFIKQNRWHFVSSPITNAMSGTFLDLYLQWFNEADSTWNFIVPVEVPLTPGKGYTSWSEPVTGDWTVTYTGILNTGNIQAPLTATDRNGGGIGDWEGWNLVGNPYPSAIDWDLIPPINMINVDPTIYVFDGVQYLSYPLQGGFGQLKNGILPAQQAFFIKANDFNPELLIPQSSRIHGVNPYKNEKVFNNLMDIKVSGNNYTDELFIHLRPDATFDYDPGIDAYKLFGIEEAPQLYTRIGDENLSICVLPEQAEEIVIPIGFRVGNSANYTFQVSGVETFSSPENIFVEDLLENEMISIYEMPEFTVQANPLDEFHRFNILFNHTSGLTETISFKPMIYYLDNSIQIIIENGEGGIIRLYSLSGQEISAISFNGDGEYKFDLEGKKGCFAVEVISNEKRFCKKVIVP